LIHLYTMRLDLPSSPVGERFEFPEFKMYLVNGTTYLSLMDDEQAARVSRGHGFRLEVVHSKEELAGLEWKYLHDDEGEWAWPSYLPERG